MTDGREAAEAQASRQVTRPVRAARLRAGVRAVTLAAVLLGAVLLVVVGAPLHDGMKRLRGAPHDNVRWALAQLEVDLLRMTQSARAAADGKTPLGEVRLRFDIFYSRVAMLRQGSAYAALREEQAVGAALDRLARFLGD